MAIKQFFVSLLPIVCGKTPFLNKIDDPGANHFFSEVMRRIDSLETSETKCAFFGMEGTIVNDDLISSVFAYQLKESKFGYYNENKFNEAFGFTIDSVHCRPTGNIELEVGNQNIKVKFDELLKQLKEAFLAFGRSDKEPNGHLAGLIVVWEKSALAFMKGKSHCEQLSKNIKSRLLYNFAPKRIKYTIEDKLNFGDSEPVIEDEYKYENHEVRIRHIPFKVYEFQKSLIQEFMEKRVKIHVFSPWPTEYLEVVIDQLKLVIPDSKSKEVVDFDFLKAKDLIEVHGSHLFTNQYEPLRSIASTKCTPVYVAGSTSEDYSMLKKFIEKGSYGHFLFREDQYQDPKNLYISEIRNHELHGTNIRIQTVDPLTAKW